MLYKDRARKRLSKAQRRKQQRRMYITVAAIAATCVGAIALMAMVNSEPTGSRYTYTTKNDIWYVNGSEPEIAAAVAEPEYVEPTDAPQQENDVWFEEAELTQAAETAEQEIESAEPEEPVEVESEEPTAILITAVGDCTLGTYKTGSGKLSAFKSYVEKNGYDYFFANVRELFSEDDLTIVNLEGPLTSHSTKRPRRAFNFRGYPEYTQILTSGSVEICNLANNHALDYKEEGFEDTYNALTEAGIGASGYGPEYYTQVNGFTVGSLGFTEWNFEVDDILEKVKAANEKCDLLIVSMHWNEEHEYKLSKYCRNMGRALIDAGADIVIGNHSHVYGEIENYKGKYIINSLGNFVFGGNDDPYVRECVIFRQKFLMYSDGTVGDGGIDIIPAFLSSTEEYNDFQPRIAEPEEGRKLLYAIANLSPNMTADKVTWLEDSYVVKNGILTSGVKAATPSPEPEEEETVAETTMTPAQTEQQGLAPTPEMEVVLDEAR